MPGSPRVAKIVNHGPQCPGADGGENKGGTRQAQIVRCRLSKVSTISRQATDLTLVCLLVFMLIKGWARAHANRRRSKIIT